MELKKRFSLQKVFVILYSFSFLIYLVIGFLPADALTYSVSGKIEIPGISLTSDVAELELKGNELPVPDLIAGSFAAAQNKVLIIGHSTTVFTDLDQVNLRDEIIYHGKTYQVMRKDLVAKQQIFMSELLKSEEADTMIIMTCAGELLPGQDATHRLIITARAL